MREGPQAALPAGWDALVDASADLDRFCSSSAWATAAHEAFGEGTPVLARAGAGAAVALARREAPRRAGVLVSLEALWGFACPVVGPDLDEGAHLVADLVDRLPGRVAGALLAGFVPGSAREAAVVARLAGRHQVGAGPTMTRRVADLRAGADTWLARRGPHFRRNLRRAVRRAHQVGLEVELVRGGPELVERAVAVDRRSWKGATGSGLAEPAMARFYRALGARLAPVGGLRAGFARLGGADVGYILGAVRGDTYRGFQLAHDEAVAALSVGNLLQWHQLGAVAAEGVGRYDLGMDMPYKLAWADEPLALTTRVLVVVP